MADRFITLRGVAVHNLKDIDLDIPHRRLIVLCGLSGSGKSSLAFDTLYAEGQRRYIESFSAYTRQFLERLEKPDAERIDGIPPAVAVSHSAPRRSMRSTVATATEIADYLRLLFAKIGRVYCLSCGQEVRRESPQSVADWTGRLPEGTRFLVTFTHELHGGVDSKARAAALREDGFVRAIAAGRMFDLSDLPEEAGAEAQWHVVVDRLSVGPASVERLRDSLETAFAMGDGRGQLILAPEAEAAVDGRGRPFELDGRAWRRVPFSTRLVCEDCDREYHQPEPRLYSFNSPLGACPTCEGFGNVIDIDLDLVVPNPRKTLREGAIAPWSTPAYALEQEALIAAAPKLGIPLDEPFASLDESQRQLLLEGSPKHKFRGLKRFFEGLDRKKYKMHVRAFLSRWRGYRPCPDCNGTRLRPEALATRVGGLNIAEIAALEVREAVKFFANIELTDWERSVGRMMLEQVRARLRYLERVGLEYLTLDRTLRTLSGGESHRVLLTSALGSSLVNMLYVLDEPSVGLHAQDTGRLLDAIRGLRDRGNTVVVVEHDDSMLRAADQLIEIGPGAGERGGQVVFQGTPAEIVEDESSLTGDYLAGRRAIRTPQRRRQPDYGWIRLAGAKGNNLKNITVEFPLGVMCVVTGVSGAGKSTLVNDTLYPALCRRLGKDSVKPLPHDDLLGAGQIDDCILVDQSAIGRSPRSNPVTYIKAFDEIRQTFAETIDARTHNYTASHFSFNVEGGRCNACNGDGYIQIDMQFLADVYMKCSVCHGRRYRSEILDVRYRGRNIADVLDLTAREAFTFFRGQPKVQAKLKKLIDVGLDYVRLGQPANTLSGGESQRLKLAGYLGGVRRGRSLFILDEPTTGLHFADVVQLLDCFDALLGVGHSLLIIEHNMQLIKSADYVIDLGPGAAEEGGRVVAQGTPEKVSRQRESVTGKFLSQLFAKEAREQSA